MNRPAVPILLWAGLQILFGIMLLIWARGGTPWLLLIAGGIWIAGFVFFIHPPARMVRRSSARSGAFLAAAAFAAILTGLFAGAWLVIIGGLAAAGALYLLIVETRAAR